MRQRLRWLLLLPALAVLAPVSVAADTTIPSGHTAAVTAMPDYPPATWVPADPSNYSPANRVHDYPIDMIVIHDIEGNAATAIQYFQTPGFAASAHYVVDYDGSITQMVQEKDIAWHAGNWDYNTRAIGIEHAGFASQNYYTTAEYDASAHLAASICSRYGVPMDRTHVIGHYQVPDPNNPGLYGGSDHHTDPGPYWNWTYYMAQASSFANALPSPPHMMTVPSVVPINGGATISWQARTCHTPVASIQVVVNPGNIVVNLPGTATSTTVTGLQNGSTYTVSVTATNADGTDSNSTSFIASPACTTPTLSAAPPSPAEPQASVTLTATTSACTNPMYRFWVQPAGANWQLARDYDPSNTFAWSAGSGSYNLEVDVRQQTSSVPYDGIASMPYSRSTTCIAATIGTDKPSPQGAGATVVVHGGGSCPATPEFRFWVGQNGIWRIVQDYSATSTFSWNTTGYALGTYGLEVDVRVQGSTAGYEAVRNLTYSLGGCTSGGLTTDKHSPQAPGTTILLTGGATCPGTPEFRFWVGQNGVWTIVQDFSASNTFSWNTTGKAFGSYGLEVDVRDHGSAESYETVANLTYSLSGCTSAGLTTDKSSPQAPGTTVALTATAACPGTPQYRFWVGQNGIWTIVQDYGASNTFSWNTTGKAAGTYGLEVDVRDQGSPESYEAVSNANFVLAMPVCGPASLVASPASQAATGAHVTLTASTAGCPSPQYRFWVSPPGGQWTVVQDYSSSNAFTWTSTVSAGTYRLEVDVRDAGSPASYDHVANISYALVGCSGAQLSTDKTPPQPHGTTVVLTGSATCPGTAQYRFWVRDLSGGWTIAQDYGSGNTFSWNTTGLAPGTYGLEVDVRDAGSTDSYETVANLTFNVT